MIDNMFEKITAIFIAGTYGAFGSVIHYLYSLSREKDGKFKWGVFFMNGLLGFFIGQLMGEFIPKDFAYRDGTLLISGFLVYQILNLLETSAVKVALRKWLGIDEKGNDIKK